MSDSIVRRVPKLLLPAALVAQLSALFVGLTPRGALAQPAPKFDCQAIQGVPTTVARNKRGQWVPIIQWVSQVFASDGWTPERRCEVVSMRFNQFYASGQLKYITSGRMNGLPVVCVTPALNSGCSGQLYTLKPHQDPADTVRRLIAINKSGGKAGVLKETLGRPYLDVEQLINPSIVVEQVNQGRQSLQPDQSQRQQPRQHDQLDPQDPNASTPLY